MAIAFWEKLHLAVTSWGLQVGDNDGQRLHRWADGVLQKSAPGSWVIFLHQGWGARAYFTRPYSAMIRDKRGTRKTTLEGREEWISGIGHRPVPLSERAQAALRLSEEASRLDARGAQAREVLSDLLREEGYDALAEELDAVAGRRGISPLALNARSLLRLKKHARMRELVEHLPGLYAAVRYAVSRIE